MLKGIPGIEVVGESHDYKFIDQQKDHNKCRQAPPHSWYDTKYYLNKCLSRGIDKMNAKKRSINKAEYESTKGWG